MNEEPDQCQSERAGLSFRLEASTVSAMTLLIRQHELCMASFLTTMWSVLHAHYVHDDEIAVWHCMLPDVAEAACTQHDPILLSIHREDQCYELVHRVQTQMDDRNRAEACSVDTLDTLSTMSKIDTTEAIDTMLSEGGRLSGLVQARWSPFSSLAGGELSQPMIQFVYEYRQGELGYTILYDRRNVDEAQIAALGGQFRVLLSGIVRDPEKPVLSHPFLTASEGEQLLRWLETDKAYARHKTVHQFIEEQAARTPEAIAVEFREQKLSYAELNRRANRVARIIRDTLLAVGGLEQLQAIPVTLVMDRSADVLPAILGVMKAGGAYLPVDPAYPEERIRFILEDAQSQVILTTRRLAAMLLPMIHQIGLAQSQMICVDECLAQYGGLDENVGVQVQPSDLAYVIYTSGSTGKPKGVLIEHQGLVALIPYLIDRLSLTPNTRMTQFASMSFDASVFEWLGTLASGGTVVALADDELPPYADMTEILAHKNIHVTLLLPSIIKTMTKRDLPALRLIISGGEACSPDLVMAWGRERLFMNAYGPTEATIISAVATCKPGVEVTIGKPVSNRHLFVLNAAGNPVPVGVPGELWVGGIGLARGYLNREELTKERFVHKELVMGDGLVPWSQRLYRTGDIVRWTADGELIYLGRSDDQVKIRGYRIELGEIENQLRSYPGIGQCLVMAWHDGQHQKLVAYYTSVAELKESALIQHLTTVLPAYMVPASFCRLEAFPLNTSGKIDRLALPHPMAMEAMAAHSEIEEGADELEQRLLEIWRQLLKRQNIGVRDHFYAVGGDSILAIQLVSMAREQGILITPRQLAEHPSVRKLAAVAVWQSDHEPKEQDDDREGEFGLTPIQHWFFEQRLEEPHYFNQSHMLVLSHCDAARLEFAVNQLIRRHPELAIQFLRSGDTYVQRYRRDVSVEVASYTIREAEEADTEIAAICARWHRELDYESGTMIRVGRIEGHPDGRLRLFLTVHHLVIDGVSWRILLQDLAQLYYGAGLPPVPGSFKQWQAAIMEYASREATTRHVAYWMEVLRQADAFSLPVDYRADRSSCSESPELVATLSASDTHRLLHQCAHAYHTRINDLLLTAWTLMLSAWSGLDTVAFRLEGHGREHCVSDRDITRTVGWFTSMFPVCIQMPTDRSLGNMIRSVKEQLRRIPDHGISYGALRYCHSSEQVRASLTGAEPQALFNYLGQFDSAESGGDEEAGQWLRFTRDAAQDHSSPENHGTSLLELNCSIIQGKLNLYVKYAKRHYEEATIARLTESFISYLLLVTEHCASQEMAGYTPSDFPFVSLNQQSLAQIVHNHGLHGLNQVLPLSPMQQGLLFHYLDHVSSDQYVVQCSWKYKGQLDADRYLEAWQRVMDENDCLRTCFVWEGLDEPVQCIVQHAKLSWTVEDISSLTQEQQHACYERWMTQDRARRFDLRQPAHRLALLRNSAEEWTVVWSYHHIVLDGWSLPLLLNRVHDLYACSEQAIAPQRNPSLSFEPYIRWLISKDRTEAEEFWRTYLAELTEPTPLPMDSSGQSFDAHQPIRTQQVETLQLDADFTGRVAAYVRQAQITLNTLVQFAWGKVLQVLHDVEVTVFGMVVSGRGSDLPAADRITGLLINTLPLVMKWDTELSVTRYVQELHHTIHKLNDYCYVNLTELKSWSALQSSTLFHSIVAFENYVNDYRQPAGELQMMGMEEREKTNYPLTITIASDGEQVTIKLIYDAERMEQDAVRRLTAYLHHVLYAAVEHPDGAVCDISLLSEDDHRRIVYDWNRTFTEYPRESSVAELFEEQAQLRPNQPAVIAYDQTLTYESLSRLSRHAARLLVEAGVNHGQYVGVYLSRSLEFIVAILGILKSGCAYVPIDPDVPIERTRDLIRDAGLETIITLRSETERVIEAGQGHRLKLIYAEAFAVDAPVEQEHEDNSAARATAADLAYLMYTSGSTGRPKGVMVEHRSIIRLVKNTNYYPFAEHMRLLYTGSPVFDASTFEIWGTLLNGGRLFVVSKDDLLNLLLLKQRMRTWDINTLWLSTALCHQWIEEDVTMFAGLRSLLVGGETLSVKLIWRLRLAHPALRILHVYGPTENTTFSTSYLLEYPDNGVQGKEQQGSEQQGSEHPEMVQRGNEHRGFELPVERHIPIGRPISNTTCYILNARGDALPIGAVGEICVGGDGVARGYWRQEELTREVFVPNKYASAEDRDKGRNLVLYRTGDRGRWLADGNIEYIGRRDGQLKLRGNRIELGEIEYRLNNSPAVKQGVVLARELLGELRLIAYYTSEAKEQGDAISAYMARHLPAYMLPYRYVELASLPLTVNGKVDRRQLPLPEAQQLRDGADPALEFMTDLEQELELIWRHVLKLASIRKDEEFYALGGHSLHALRIVSMLHKNGHTVTVNQIMREQTIERLARSLSEARAESPGAGVIGTDAQRGSSALRTYPHDGFPLSAVQRRFFTRDLKELNLFNFPYMGLLKRTVTREELSRALQLLVQRHAALRLTFARSEQGEWYQYEQELDSDQLLTCIDLREETSHDTVISNCCVRLQQELNLESGPLWRAVLFEHYGSGCGQVLLLLFHHSICDGMSLKIILEDLALFNESGWEHEGAQHEAAHHGEADAGSSYGDWCEELTHYAASGIPGEVEAYWREVVAGGELLRTDRDTEAWPLHSQMATITVELLEGSEQVRALKEYAAEQQTSPLGVLLTVWAQTCYDLTGQSDLLLHLMSYQRESFLPNLSLYRTVGFFAGAYPVRLRIGERELAGDGAAVLEQVRAMLQQIPHDGMDYLALRYIVPQLHPEAEPLADSSRMLFHYQSEEIAWQADDFHEPLSLPYGHTNAPDNPSAYWLNMTACLRRDSLSLTCYYSTLHYGEATVAELMRRYAAHLRQCIHASRFIHSQR